MTTPTIQSYEYHAWANGIVFEHLRKLPEEVWNGEVTSVFPTVCTLMSHVYAMDAMWLSVMQERPFDEARELLMQKLAESKTESLSGMERRFKETAGQYRSFLKACDPEKVITLSHPVFGSMHPTVSGLVQHVVNHGTYHLGNLTAMLRQLGHPGTPTDYIFYLFTV